LDADAACRRSTQVWAKTDPARPAGIWRFAWAEAARRISDRQDIVLAANPRSRRTQDQLHIHIARLAEGARERFLALKPLRVASLRGVWAAAARHAAAAGLPADGYGAGVIAGPAGGWLVAASSESLEGMFSAYSCSARPAWKPGDPDRE
jgi:CDP-diacylglycerol pyrophosphatase